MRIHFQKRSVKNILIIFLTLAILAGLPARVSALTTIWPSLTLDSYGNVGSFPSLAIVNGNPAISYFNGSTGDLKYIRAEDAAGTSWQSQILDSSGTVGHYTSLAVVNGNPAISYYDITNSALKFIRAKDANGTEWYDPQTLDSDGTVGLHTSLAVVNGNPAISYYDVTHSDLKYIRAENADGTSWSSPKTVDSNGYAGEYTSLAVVNGNPAISYYDSGFSKLRFTRANDADGTSWGNSRYVVMSDDVGEYTSLAVVNGNPAISYYDENNRDLKYIRASNANGSSWGSPRTLDSSGTVGQHTSLAVVNGVPAISYYDASNDSLKYIQAKNANGTDWYSPQILDSDGNVGIYTSLADMNGVPAISYFDNTKSNLKFIYFQGTVDLTLLESGSSINSGSTLNFGSTTLNTPITKTLTLQNNGSLALDLNSISLPSGYSLSGSYASSIPAGSSEDIQVRLDAIQTGTFSGSLSIQNSDTKKTPYTFTLTGEVTTPRGEIAIREGVTDIPDGSGSADFGTTTTGTPIVKTFTVENSGAYDLQLLSLTLPSGFNLVNSYDSIIAASGSTTIQISLNAQTAGTFSGEFSLASNDADENPFNFTLTGEVTTPRGEIAVSEGGTDIPDGSGSVDFGTTTTGTAVTKTFTIRNSGVHDLDLGSLSLPNGFSLVGSYASSVTPGSSTSLQVRLDAQTSGTFSGEFSLENNDEDEDPFNFTLSGKASANTLTAPLLSPVDGSVILNSTLQAAFNQPVRSGGGDEAADNPANYLLVKTGSNGVFDTSTCAAGVEGDDIEVTISNVAYDSSTYIATITPEAMSTGKYQLLVCGTASIEGVDGNVLNNGLYDSATTFTVISNSSGEGSGALAGLPATGFAPDQSTRLPSQPENSLYSDLPDLSLNIPELGINLPIVGVPQTENGWDVTWLTNAEIGWLNGSAFPTWEGNTVLTGHVTNASGQAGPFADLHELGYGDKVILQAYGQTYTYEVRESLLVLPNNLSSVMDSRERDWVTLMTCEYYNELSGEYLFRRIVRAVLVEVE